MTATNKPMTGEQLDELMTVSVNMQRESEKLGDRSAAMFAYAVQVAVLELRSVRNVVEQLAAENSSIKAMNDCLSEELRGYESDGAFDGPKMHLLWLKAETPATDAILAEVRASGVEMFAAHKRERQQALRSRSMRMSEEAAVMAADADNFADELRKGVQS